MTSLIAAHVSVSVVRPAVGSGALVDVDGVGRAEVDADGFVSALSGAAPAVAVHPARISAPMTAVAAMIARMLRERFCMWWWSFVSVVEMGDRAVDGAQFGRERR
jgi:hypothetical protein